MFNNEICARVALAFPDLKRDLYDKLEDTNRRVHSISDNLHNNNEIGEEIVNDIQEQLSKFDTKNKVLSQMIDKVSIRMQSEIELVYKNCDKQTDGVKEKLVDLENRLFDFVQSKINETVENITKVQTVSEIVSSNPKSCRETTVHGAVTIYPNFQPSGLRVFCDQHTDGGGWIVFQRRQDGSVDFYRGWKDYEDGFGSVDGEFWLGNKYLHLFTENQRVELRIDMKDFEGNSAFAHYSDFEIAQASDKYRLNVGEYSGTAGDGLQTDKNKQGSQDGQQFSTFDSDNDQSRTGSCAKTWKGASWYNECFEANLNGEYLLASKGNDIGRGIIWYPWKGFGYSLKFVEMKFTVSS